MFIKNLICVFLISGIAGYSQAPSIDWQKTIGGDNRDVASCVLTTTDNGTLIAGLSESSISGDKNDTSRGGTDIWLVKLSPSGILEWQKTIGGNEDDFVNSIIVANDGGYLLGGASFSDISGEKTEDSRGGSDIWILKINESGTIEWQKTIGGTGADGVTSLCSAGNNGYILGASTYQSGISGEKTVADFGEIDFWVVKIDNLGTIIWQSLYGGIYDDEITSVSETTTGDLLLCGHSNSPVSGNKTEDSMSWDFWVIKTDFLGSIIWQNTLGGNDSELDSKLKLLSNGNILLGGTSFSQASGDKSENNYGERDFWIIKLDENGSKIWDRTLGGNNLDQFKNILEVADDNYIVGGGSYSSISGIKTEISRGQSDYWLIKLNTLGEIEWDKTIGGDGIDGINSFTLNNNSLMICGTSYSNISGEKNENSRGATDYWIVKLQPESLSTSNSNLFNLQIYPNPTTQTIYIDFDKPFLAIKTKIFNTIGQLISENKFTNSSSFSLDIKAESGIYLVEIENENGDKKVFKVIKK